VRAVLEGVAYALRDSLDLVRAAGAPAEVGRVSGGGAASDLWLRIVASALDLPLQRVAVQEGAAYGAALLGGVVGGVFDDPREAVAACVRPGEVIDPDAGWTAAYAEGREDFRALYPALRGRDTTSLS
jgi:xylulokinase